MKELAIRLVTYPVLVILTLVLVGPTIPIDISILLITSIVAAMGLSGKGDASVLRSYTAAWRAQVSDLWKIARPRR